MITRRHSCDVLADQEGRERAVSLTGVVARYAAAVTSIMPRVSCCIRGALRVHLGCGMGFCSVYMPFPDVSDVSCLEVRPVGVTISYGLSA